MKRRWVPGGSTAFSANSPCSLTTAYGRIFEVTSILNRPYSTLNVSGTIRAPGEVSNATSIRTGVDMGRTVDWGETIVIDGSVIDGSLAAPSNAAAGTTNIEIARATHHRMR